MRTSALLTALTLLAICCGLGQAQVSFDANTQLLIIKAAAEGAEKSLAEGKPNVARVSLLAVSELLQRNLARIPADVQQRYQAAMAKAWPTAVSEANSPQMLAEWKAAIEKSQPALTRFAMNMDFFQPHDNLSFEQWAEYVLGAQAMYPQAEACCAEYAAAAPNTVLHLSEAGTRLGAFQLAHLLYVIAVAEPLSKEFAEKDVLPRSLKKSEEKLAAIPADTDNASTVAMGAAEARRLVTYALAVDSKNEQAKALLARVQAAEKRAGELYDKQVAANRMPGESYQGAEAGKLREEMAAAFTKAWPNCRISKIQITSANWVERAEAWWEGEVVKSGVFRFIDGAVAGTEKDGQLRVYCVTFARQWTGTGDTFGGLYLATNRYSYAMLPENL